MDEFIDPTTITTDQKFMFMLLDKIDKLEEQITTINKTLYGKPNKVADIAKDLYDKIEKKKNDLDRLEVEEKYNKLRELIPEHLVVKISKNLHNDLLASLESDANKHSFVCYYACRFLERVTDIDKEFINWFTDKLNLLDT
jgi:hypothetical protein